MPDFEWDVFISHASEDSRDAALPLRDALEHAGLKVWIDGTELSLGDSLRGKITEGLARCRFGVVIFSPSFLAKRWPKDEMHALLAREEAGAKVLLPVRHRLTRVQLAEADPLIADRLDADLADGLDRVAAQIVAVVRGAAPTSPAAAVAVDMAHGQRQWEHLGKAVAASGRFTLLERGLLEERGVLDAARVLVMPPPFHVRLTRAEIDLIEERVDDGMGLLLMGCYAERHHATNFSELAWRFDLEFLDEIVMPAQSQEWDVRRTVFNREAGLATPATVPEGAQHPLLHGVRQPLFLSAAPIRQTTETATELVLTSGPLSCRYRPLGHIDAEGARPAIDRWALHGNGPVQLLVAMRHGRGRVVAAGTWKLWTVDGDDNARLIDNALSWLGAGS